MRRDIYCIGPGNPYVGEWLRVTWLKPWGKYPAGFKATGRLEATFCVKGRTLIGELRLADGRKLACPWSRNYLDVQAAGEKLAQPKHPQPAKRSLSPFLVVLEGNCTYGTFTKCYKSRYVAERNVTVVAVPAQDAAHAKSIGLGMGKVQGVYARPK